MKQETSSLNFAICVVAEENGNLEIWKLYEVLPDEKAKEVGCLRVVDESEEDYLYPENHFVMIEISETTQFKLLSVRR